MDLVSVADEAVRMAKPALKETDASLVREVEPVPPVEGNRASLVQVVLALVTNAAQAVPRAGDRVTVAQERGEVVLTVADEGSGMTPDVEARAFEPFFTTRPGWASASACPSCRGSSTGWAAGLARDRDWRRHHRDRPPPGAERQRRRAQDPRREPPRPPPRRLAHPPAHPEARAALSYADKDSTA